MESSTLSKKYQVVIPKAIRKKLISNPGQQVYITMTSPTKVTIDFSSKVDQYVGSMKGAWGEDSTKYLREMRDDWDSPDEQ